MEEEVRAKSDNEMYEEALKAKEVLTKIRTELGKNKKELNR